MTNDGLSRRAEVPITRKRVPQDDTGSVGDEVYNGSAWIVKEITIHMQLTDFYVGRVVFDDNVTLPLEVKRNGWTVELRNEWNAKHATGEPSKSSYYLAEHVLPPRNGRSGALTIFVLWRIAEPDSRIPHRSLERLGHGTEATNLGLGNSQ